MKATIIRSVLGLGLASVLAIGSVWAQPGPGAGRGPAAKCPLTTEQRAEHQWEMQTLRAERQAQAAQRQAQAGGRHFYSASRSQGAGPRGPRQGCPFAAQS